ncbi:hypothetical protein C8R45DRAFT_983728 [Mycena sanguinolenta]|nr:hypothetical protein C8R45DRAFT_983728 [Mycena sanguinolenta]
MSCDCEEAGRRRRVPSLIYFTWIAPRPQHFAAASMQQDYTMEVDLCELLLVKRESPRVDDQTLPFTVHTDDSNMPELEETPHLRPNSPSDSEPSYQGCAYLQAIQSQLKLENSHTTGGEFIELIFTHRSLLFAFPGGHACCARAFSDLACSLQRREWTADREANMETFNYEAQFIASVIR